MHHTTTAQPEPTMQPCGHHHTWPRPAACDPEPDRTTDPGGWHAWRLREQARIPADQLLPVQR